MSSNAPGVTDNFVTNTAYIIPRSNMTLTGYMNLKSKLSIVEYRTNDEIPKAIFEEEGYVFFPKIPIAVVCYALGKQIGFKRIPDIESSPNKEYRLAYPPLPYQVSVIEDGYRKLTDMSSMRDTRICICLKPGMGKTYCTSAIISKLQTKFIFIVYNSNITEQAKEAMSTQLGCKNLFILERGSDIEELLYDKIDGLYMTHSMFKSIVKTYGIAYVNDVIFNKIGINTKVLDEFDTEVSSMYFIDSCMNFRYSIYLTGTKFKSLKVDDRLFQSVYGKVKTLGMDVKVPENKSALFIHYKYDPSSSEFGQIMRDDSSFKIFYNNFLARKDNLLDYIMLKLFSNPAHTDESNKTKLFRRLTESEYGQVQFFTGRIGNCDVVASKLHKKFGIPMEDIGIMNSSISRAEKEKALTRPYLVSTCSSLGRGVDSEKVRALVFLEFHFSTSIWLQALARVGRIGKKHGYVIFPVDHSFTKALDSFTAKRNELFGEGYDHIVELATPPDWNSNYVNGYDKDTPEAEAILKKRAKSAAIRKLSKGIRNM